MNNKTGGKERPCSSVSCCPYRVNLTRSRLKEEQSKIGEKLSSFLRRLYYSISLQKHRENPTEIQKLPFCAFSNAVY